jgi:hypothetical protein
MMSRGLIWLHGISVFLMSFWKSVRKEAGEQEGRGERNGGRRKAGRLGREF